MRLAVSNELRLNGCLSYSRLLVYHKLLYNKVFYINGR